MEPKRQKSSHGVAVCGESRTHGGNGGDGETGCKVPRSVPTHSIMRVACATPASATGGLVLELKAKGHDEGEDTFEERLPIAKQLEIPDSPGFSRKFSTY